VVLVQVDNGGGGGGSGGFCSVHSSLPTGVWLLDLLGGGGGEVFLIDDDRNGAGGGLNCLAGVERAEVIASG